MALRIEPEDPRSGEGPALIGASDALSQSHYPPEHSYPIDIDALAGPLNLFMEKRLGKGEQA